MTKKEPRIIPSYVKNFNSLKAKLKMILSDNPNLNKFKFWGMELSDNSFEKGIAVDGMDSNGIGWSKFFPAKKIHEKYEELEKRLSL